MRKQNKYDFCSLVCFRTDCLVQHCVEPCSAGFIKSHKKNNDNTECKIYKRNLYKIFICAPNSVGLIKKNKKTLTSIHSTIKKS